MSPDLKSEVEPKKEDDLHYSYYGDGTSETGFSIFEKDDDKTAERKTRYDYYREMDTNEFIHRALEIVADDSTQANPEGNAIKIYSDDEEIKTKIEELFLNKLDMNNELWSIMFETCKMGDNFYEVVVDDYKKPKNVIFLRYLEPDKVDRIEDNGRLAYFTYKTTNIDNDKSKAKKEEEVIYKLQPWQIIHFKLENKQFSPYGSSLLYPGLRTYRRLNLLEDVMIVYRLSRAPERRVFYIDVGNLNRIEARRFLEKVKNQYRTSSFIDEDGKINKKARMLSITNDIFVPVREGGAGTKIETLQGGEALHNIDDMKYFRDKILRVMNIPPAYLGDEADRSRGTLSQLDIKFSRFIERIQTQIIKSLNKVAALELFFGGYKKEKLNDFEIELTAPSNIKEITEIDMMNQRMGLLSTIQALGIFSNQWMLKNILKLSDAEIADIELYKRIEATEQPPEIPGAEGVPAVVPGEEVPPEAGTPETGAVPPETPGELPAPGEEVPPVAPAPETAEEIAASTMIKILGKEFVVENSKDFFKIINFIAKEKNIEKTAEFEEMIEDISNLLMPKEEKPNTNNIRRQFIINEFGGLVFEKGTGKQIKIWENYRGKRDGKPVTKYRTKSVLLG